MSETRSLNVGKISNTLLWGNSVAMSWMWGLGLFFSVQFAVLFGLFGLLFFAIPNALGLVLYGIGVEIIARREKKDGLAMFFTKWSRPFRLIFYLYQILALTLTVFAGLRYMLQPLGLEPKLMALYLPLTVLVILAAGAVFGEEFNIKRIKYSHAVLGVIIGLCMVVILYGTVWNHLDIPKAIGSVSNVQNISFWGYAIPLCIGLLLGPWLDLQQWQRAIQMKKEGLSIAWSYFAGAIIFFLMLLFHGSIALWCVDLFGLQFSTISSFDGHQYSQGMLAKLFYSFPDSSSFFGWLIFPAYLVFISNCLITTLDSGYISLKWFLSSNVKSSKHAIFALIPEKLVTSPLPSFLLCGIFALAAAVIQLELEYFMIFYATFFVGYEALAVFRGFRPQSGDYLPQVKMFGIGCIAVVMFSYGYFQNIPVFQICGSLLPLAYFGWLLIKPEAYLEFVADPDNDLPGTQPLMAPPAKTVSTTPTQAIVANPSPTSGAVAVQYVNKSKGYFEDKWFVYEQMVSYSDTNSVGNVYFAMYAMWVGKTRELFFHECLPDFQLSTTSFYILTRSFTHKYIRETREFEEVKTKVRVKKYNRKFATLEHQIFDGAGNLLGEGEQSLMFVSSKDYSLIDVPQEVYNAFVKYI